MLYCGWFYCGRKNNNKKQVGKKKKKKVSPLRKNYSIQQQQ